MCRLRNSQQQRAECVFLPVLGWTVPLNTTRPQGKTAAAGSFLRLKGTKSCNSQLFERVLQTTIWTLVVQTDGLPHFIGPLGLLLCTPMGGTFLQAFLSHPFTAGLHCWPRKTEQKQKTKNPQCMSDRGSFSLHSALISNKLVPFLQKLNCEAWLKKNPSI